MKIAIDGPGGAGKSSMAKLLAARAGLVYVDTGAMYRTVGLYMRRHGADTSCSSEVVPLLGEVELEIRWTDAGQRMFLCGEDVSEAIRTPEASLDASAVSAIPEVRQFLLKVQRDLCDKGNVIMDGRDIGTVIMPDADLKVFLTASPEARARRRFDELISKGKDVKYEDVLAEMNQRDEKDSGRAVAPLVPAEDAVLLDNSDMNLEQTVDYIENLMKNVVL